MLSVIVLPGVLWACGAALADSTSVRGGGDLSEAEQQSALEFARTHHPQLNGLIARLKQRDPAEYQKAVSNILKTSERLQRLQRRDRPRYEVELKLWKVESRIRLLAVRLAADQSSALQNQLRALLNERVDLRLQQLTLERERLAGRLERLDDHFSRLSNDREGVIDKEIERLRRSVRDRSSRVSRKRKSLPRSAAEKPSSASKQPSERRSPAAAPAASEP